MDLTPGTSQDEFNKKNSEKNDAGKFVLEMVSITGFIYVLNWLDLIFNTEKPQTKALSGAAVIEKICLDAEIYNPSGHYSEYKISAGIRVRY